MANITAAVVKELRDKTGLPMMECKRALEESGGDIEQAIEILRKAGQKVMAKRADRETAFGRIGVFTDEANNVTGLVELLCESAPVAKNDEFTAMADELAKQLAVGPGASSVDELLSQNSPVEPSKTLQDRLGEVINRIREKFVVNRILRVEGACGVYLHHDGSKAAVVEIKGDDVGLAREIAMHVVAMRPIALKPEDLPEELVAKEREVYLERAKASGKPENIIERIVESSLKTFYSEKCLLEQPFFKEPKKTVGQVAKAGGIEVVRYTYWEIGKE
ncbi:translation elongation factor Ts [Thermostilla marina]